MSVNKSGRVQVGLRTSRELKDRIDSFCERAGVPRNTLLVTLVEEGMNAAENAEATRRGYGPQGQAGFAAQVRMRPSTRYESGEAPGQDANMGDMSDTWKRDMAAAAAGEPVPRDDPLDQPHDVRGNPVERPDKNRMEEQARELEEFEATVDLDQQQEVEEAEANLRNNLAQRHTHRCDQLVEGSEHWNKGQKFAQYACECGKIAVKRYQKKAM